MVVIADKKNPKQSIIIHSNDIHNGQFEIIDVNTNSLDYRETSVNLMIDNQRHTVEYESSNFIVAGKAVVKNNSTNSLSNALNSSSRASAPRSNTTKTTTSFGGNTSGAFGGGNNTTGAGNDSASGFSPDLKLRPKVRRATDNDDEDAGSEPSRPRIRRVRVR